MPGASQEWKTIGTERNGLVNLSREYGLPLPEPNRAVAWLKTTITSDRKQTKKADIGWTHQDSQVAAIIEASDGLSAVEIIQSRRPDLVFLDVQMPELNGVEVIAEVGAERMPLTVFVTAYDFSMRSAPLKQMRSTIS
jgi:CheY-like chemotaxis protein